MRGPRRTSSASRDTRARVLKVALELIAEKGFAATTTREISERLGFTKAALYYHFHTKDDLLAALIAPLQEYLEVMVKDKSVVSREAARQELLVAYVDLVCMQADLIRVLSQDASIASNPAILAFIPLFDRLTQLLTGEEIPDERHRAMVRAALGGIHSVVLHARPEDDRAIMRQAAFDAASAVIGLTMPVSLR